MIAAVKVEALVTAIAALVAAIGGVVGALRIGRTRRALEGQLDPHNAKSVGDTIHEVAQTVQYVADVQHQHTRTLDAHGQLIEDVRKRVGNVETKLDGHIEERKTFEPLIGWVKRQMAGSSAQKEE